MAGPVEYEGDGKADEEGLEEAQHRAEETAQIVEFHDDQHQHHRVGDNPQNAAEELFVHMTAPVGNILQIVSYYIYH